MTLPHTPLLSRALARAIALLDGGLRGGLSCREVLKGEKPSELRAELKQCQELLAKLTPAGKAEHPKDTEAQRR